MDEGEEAVCVVKQVQVEQTEPGGALEGVEQEQGPARVHGLQGTGQAPLTPSPASHCAPDTLMPLALGCFCMVCTMNGKKEPSSSYFREFMENGIKK